MVFVAVLKEWDLFASKYKPCQLGIALRENARML